MLRLNLADPKDVEWLQKRRLFDKVVKEMKKKSIVTIESPQENRLERKSSGGKNKKTRYPSKRFKKEGVTWQSQYEYDCWLVLKDLQKQKKIKNLSRQVSKKFIHNGVVLWRNVIDFYFEVGDENFPVFADAKSTYTENTRTWKTTQKFFQAYYGHPVVVFLSDKKTNIEQAINHHLTLFT